MSPTRTIIPLICSLATFASAQADFVGLNIGAYAWNPDISGSFRTGSDSRIQLQNDLGFNDDTGNGLRVSLEHPVPALPNVRYQTVDL